MTDDCSCAKQILDGWSQRSVRPKFAGRNHADITITGNLPRGSCDGGSIPQAARENRRVTAGER